MDVRHAEPPVDLSASEVVLEQRRRAGAREQSAWSGCLAGSGRRCAPDCVLDPKLIRPRREDDGRVARSSRSPRAAIGAQEIAEARERLDALPPVACSYPRIELAPGLAGSRARERRLRTDALAPEKAACTFALSRVLELSQRHRDEGPALPRRREGSGA